VLLAAGLLASAALVVVTGSAEAAATARSSQHSHPHAHHKRHGRRHAGPRMPVVTNATDLSLEPVVHRSRGKPPTTLEVKDLVVGTGAAVTMSSTVSVVYVGANYRTGKDFTQATWTSGHPTTFPLSGVVRGFAQGLVGMRVGGRREIVIPPRLGYGDHHYGPIEPGETLVFVVDLKGVTP